MDYSDLIDFISVTFQVPVTNDTIAAPFVDPNANIFLARAIDQAEQRIYTDFGDMLCTRQQNAANNCVANSRQFTLPSLCVVAEGISIITPVSTTPANGKRNDCEKVSLDTIDFRYPSEKSNTGVPRFWAMLSDSIVALGKTPDATYTVEVTGYFRPLPISASNMTTYIATNYPQLLQAAIAVVWTGYQRDYGAQSDDPKMALSWKSEYNDLIKGAIAEEKRRKGENPDTATSAPVQPSPQPASV